MLANPFLFKKKAFSSSPSRFLYLYFNNVIYSTKIEVIVPNSGHRLKNYFSETINYTSW